jgi:hypothetical protein
MHEKLIASPEFRLFLLLVFGIPGLGVLTYGGWLLYRAHKSNAWPTVQGRIVTSEVVIVPHSRDTATLKICFAYSVGKVSYRSDQFRLGDADQGHSIRDARDTVGWYREGTVVPVYYNPTDPGDAVLEPGNASYGYLFCFLGSLLIVVGAVLYYFPWLLYLGHILHLRLPG